MKIEKTHFGLRVTIPETEYSSEFVYNLRNVRVLNDNEPQEQPLLAELEKREIPLVRQFLLRAWSMWNIIKNMPQDEGVGEDNTIMQYLERWQEHNRLDFTDYYHHGLQGLEEAIDGISIEYCERSEHGWCW